MGRTAVKDNTSSSMVTATREEKDPLFLRANL